MPDIPTQLSSLFRMLEWRVDSVCDFLKKNKEDIYFFTTKGDEKIGQISNQSIFSGVFQVKEDKIHLVFASYDYWYPDPPLPDDMNIPPYGPPSAELSSRAGKTFTQYVWPEQGFSIATNHHEIGFIEVFHPTTLEDYKAKFWTDPEWHKKYNK